MFIIDDISKFECLINTVLIRPLRSNDQILIDGDKALYIDTSFEKMFHAPVVGVVAAVPSQLYFKKGKMPHNSLDWETEMELEVGDIVNYHFLDIRTAIEQDDYVLCDGKIYYPIRYDRIFCAKRKLPKGNITITAGGNFVTGDDGIYKVVMLNGYILASPVEKKIETQLMIPDSMKGKHDARYGIVRFSGSCNKRYRNFYPPDDPRIENGMLIILDHVCDIKLEYDLHASFDGSATYFRVERRNIQGFIKL